MDLATSAALPVEEIRKSEFQMVSDFARRRAAWLLGFILVLGFFGYRATDRVVGYLVATGHTAAVQTVAASLVEEGNTQNARMQYAFSGALPQPAGSVAQLQQRARISWTRVWLGLLGLWAAGAVWQRRAAVRALGHEWVTATSYPHTLALLRIIVFGWLMGRLDTGKFLMLADFPRELAMPPPGLGWLLAGPLVSVKAMAMSGQLFVVFCFLAMIGLCTRLSAALAVVLGIYTAAIPKLFGATVYQHCMFWFAAVCAAAPSGDAFSIDALITAWRRPRVAVARLSEPQSAYAIPLRVCWLLFIPVYFFPGFWKLWNCGFDWLLSGNLVGVMHGRWLDAQKLPWPRIDRMPVLLTLGAINSLVFELGFPLAILHPRTRLLALLEGALFHGMNKVFLYFDFLHLVYCYVIFFDCRKFFARCGRLLFGEPVVLNFAPNVARAQRVAALLCMVDVFSALVVLPASEPTDSGLSIRQGTVTGLAAVRAVLLRLPLAWPLLPILGPLLYVAWRRTAPVADSSVDSHPQRAARLALRLGLGMVAAATVAGALELDRGWPFACYPPFGWLSGEYRHAVRITTVDTQDHKVVLKESLLSKQLGPQWKAQLFGFVLLTPDAELQRRRLLALFRLYQQCAPAASRAANPPKEVQFDAVTLYLDPDALHEVHSERLLTWSPTASNLANPASER